MMFSEFVNNLSIRLQNLKKSKFLSKELKSNQ